MSALLKHLYFGIPGQPQIRCTGYGRQPLSPYDEGRLDDRFKDIDKALADVQYHVRTFAPVATQVGVIDAKLADARDEIRDLRAEYKADRASSRAEVVKLVGIVVGAFIAAAGTVAAAVATGIVGG
jgi:hypothetical protein